MDGKPQVETRLHAQRGEPMNEELQSLIQFFVEEYTTRYEANRWHMICGYSEETIRRILNRTTDIILERKNPDQQQWQQQFNKIIRDVVLARISYPRL